MNEDRCVCCGEYVPEGQMVCHSCMCKSITYNPTRQEGDMAIEQLNESDVSFCEKLSIKTMIHGLITLIRKLFSCIKKNT